MLTSPVDIAPVPRDMATTVVFQAVSRRMREWRYLSDNNIARPVLLPIFNALQDSMVLHLPRNKGICRYMFKLRASP